MHMHQSAGGTGEVRNYSKWNICRRQRWSSVLFADVFGFTAPQRSIITL